MAKHDCKSGPAISQIQRVLKVGYISVAHPDRKTGGTSHYSRSPALNLKGQWLAECGFTTDTPVKVRVMPGCLVITAQSAPPSASTASAAGDLLARSEALPESARQELRTVMEALLIREGLDKVGG